MPASDDRQRAALIALVTPPLAPGERLVAVLPFVNTPKRPKTPSGKVRNGIWQAGKRYRPMLLTDQRLVVFDTNRTPHPQRVLVEYPVDLVRLVRLSAGTLGRQTLVLDLPAEGEVPFELGRRDAEDFDAFARAFGYQTRS